MYIYACVKILVYNCVLYIACVAVLRMVSYIPCGSP